MRQVTRRKRRNDEGMSNYKPSAGGRAGGGRAGGGRAGVEGGLLRDKTVLFTPQSEGYPHYRIPALLLAGQVLLMLPPKLLPARQPSPSAHAIGYGACPL